MENRNLTPEMLEQASKAPSAAALLALAKEKGITLTAEEAAIFFAQLHPQSGAISDEELDNVSGGDGGNVCDKYFAETPKPNKCVLCGQTEFVQKQAELDGYIVKRWVCKHCGTWH